MSAGAPQTPHDSSLISPELSTALKKLRASPIEYSESNKVFMLRTDATTRIPKRGLTTVLADVFPVPFVAKDESDTVQPKTKKARRSAGDPKPEFNVWHRVKCRTPSALTCKEATLHNHVFGVTDAFGMKGFGPDFCKRHGMLVDQQLQYIVQNGYRMTSIVGMVLDPCVAALRDYFHENKLAPVASQVPLYSPELDIATALDVLCTDQATKSELHLCEVKSTTGNSADDDHYLRVRGRLVSSVARGTPLSFYVRHQMQLGVMDTMIHETLGRSPTSSAVLRVSPNCVRVYKLTPWFNERSKKLLPVIKRRGVKRAKRAHRQQMKTK
jgi:hypothetical protein